MSTLTGLAPERAEWMAQQAAPDRLDAANRLAEQLHGRDVKARDVVHALGRIAVRPLRPGATPVQQPCCDSDADTAQGCAHAGRAKVALVALDGPAEDLCPAA